MKKIVVVAALLAASVAAYAEALVHVGTAGGIMIFVDVHTAKIVGDKVQAVSIAVNAEGTKTPSVWQINRADCKKGRGIIQAQMQNDAFDMEFEFGNSGPKSRGAEAICRRAQ